MPKLRISQERGHSEIGWLGKKKSAPTKGRYHNKQNNSYAYFILSLILVRSARSFDSHTASILVRRQICEIFTHLTPQGHSTRSKSLQHDQCNSRNSRKSCNKQITTTIKQTTQLKWLENVTMCVGRKSSLQMYIGFHDPTTLYVQHKNRARTEHLQSVPSSAGRHLYHYHNNIAIVCNKTIEYFLVMASLMLLPSAFAADADR